MAAPSVLITGAGGFVGANLVRRALADGHRTTATVSPRGQRWRLADLERETTILELDLRDAEAVATAVSRERPEWVFHLAAHGAYSHQQDARRIVETNVLGTIHLADACLRADVAALVHAGSSSEYGFKDHPPSEVERLEPNSTYAVAKAAATHYLSYLGAQHGLRTATLRLYSVYGPWEDPGRLIPTLVARGLAGELPPLVSPDIARDFVYVDDVCEAFIAAASSRPGGEVLNIGSGRQTTLRQVVEVARNVLGIGASPEWGSMPQRRWDTASWVADSRRARDLLGWTARTELAVGLELTAQWLRQRRDQWKRYGVAL